MTTVTSVPFEHGLILAAILFVIGLAGVAVRRNLVFILISLEVMLNATGMAFIAAGARWAAPDGQIMYLFILTMAAAEVAVGLALALLFRHRFDTLDSDAATTVRE